MAGYIGVPIEDDPDVLIAGALDELAANVPAFESREHHLEVWLLEVCGRMNAETRNVTRRVFDDIFQYFGESLVGVLPVLAVPATALTTWTMLDAAGYTIEEGTLVGYRTSGDTIASFETVGTYVVEPGDTTALEVAIRAQVAGISGNGLGPDGLELIDSLAFVDSVTATAPTAGGVDAETTEQYLSRLREEMTLLSPSFVLAKDAAVMARRIAGVYRAFGIDNYNPADDTFDNEKMIAVAVVGADGAALGSDVKDAVAAYLESMRETNFVVNVIDPTFTVVDVDFTVVAVPGYDLADLTTRCVAEVEAYLNPATWGGGETGLRDWNGEDTVRFLEVAQVLNMVDGVRYVSDLTLNGGGVDVPLAGVAPLPTVGAVTGEAVSA